MSKITTKEDAPEEASPSTAKREPIDSKWVDIILGKPDAVRMRECVEIIKDSEKSVAEKLVESLDNANDLRTLGLWKPILAVLRNEPDSKLRAAAAWVAGTAVQNNAKSQKDLLDEGGIEILLMALESETDGAVKAKVITCISGLIRHNPTALAHVRKLNGLKVLVSMLSLRSPNSKGDEEEDVDKRIKKRILFLLQGIVETEENQEVLESIMGEAEKDGWVMAAACCLEGDENDVDLMEKTLSFLLAITRGRNSLILPATTSLIQGFLANRTSALEAMDSELIENVRAAFA
ncbi:armadillo-type protein [Chytridium lagenaria]|nr:armadillo-type protein [Chytridium lagenaria]